MWNKFGTFEVLFSKKNDFEFSPSTTMSWLNESLYRPLFTLSKKKRKFIPYFRYIFSLDHQYWAILYLNIHVFKKNNIFKYIV